MHPSKSNFRDKYCSGDRTLNCTDCKFNTKCDHHVQIFLEEEGCGDCLLKNTCIIICPIMHKKMRINDVDL